MHHVGDLPARSGMGSSSAFTVGLLHALHALQGRMVGKEELMTEAIFTEQELLKETVGSQDQASAAHGGFNKITFAQNGQIQVAPVVLRPGRTDELDSHLMLFYTGIVRPGSVSVARLCPERRDLMNHPLSASRLLSALFLLMAACLAATTGSPLRSAAAPPPPPHVLTPPLEESPFRATGPSATMPSDGLLPDDLTATSKIVFQSYRDNNWEIYVARGNGGYPVRLTYDAAPALAPPSQG